MLYALKGRVFPNLAWKAMSLVSPFAGGGPKAYLSDLLQRGPAARRRREATTSAAAARGPLSVLAAVTGEGGGKGETANQKMERPRALALPLVSSVQDLRCRSREMNACK